MCWVVSDLCGTSAWFYHGMKKAAPNSFQARGEHYDKTQFVTFSILSVNKISFFCDTQIAESNLIVGSMDRGI